MVPTRTIQTFKKSSQIITTNIPTLRFFEFGCPSYCPTDSVKALKWQTEPVNIQKKTISVINQ